jgi:hypothetical protein
MTRTESTPTTVRFVFRAKAGKPALRVKGGGALILPDAPAENVLERSLAVQSRVIIRRGASSATFVVPPAGARYEFSRRIGILFQEVGLSGQITRSTIRTCSVGSVGTITLETEHNAPSRRALLGAGSFADNGVVFRVCGVRGEDPRALATIVVTP